MPYPASESEYNRSQALIHIGLEEQVAEEALSLEPTQFPFANQTAQTSF